MADPEMDDDLFADLYDVDDVAPEISVKPEAEPAESTETVKQEPASNGPQDDDDDIDINLGDDGQAADSKPNAMKMEGGQDWNNDQQNGGYGGDNTHTQDYERQAASKEDGKMFIGGLNWETTDQSLKDYFSQFGEIFECTVMRDGASGRSRGFGFLTFKDAKTVNVVMVKEHQLDGKIIDPKRAIPRDEQEKTSKIFVGGVSQDATEQDFTTFFLQFGRVLDSTLMMDKDTGRPRGFGFVTFENEAAVDRALQQPLAICGKPIEVKKAQPRSNLRDEDNDRRGKFGRGGGSGGGQYNNNPKYDQQNQGAAAQNGQANPNNMTPAMAAAYWQRMQQMMVQMRQQVSASMNPMAQMQNPMMQQMMAMQQQGMNRGMNGGMNGGMNPAMMQQMQQIQQMNQGGYPGIPNNGGMASPMNGASSANRPGFNAQEQMMFEQRKYEQQSTGRVGPGYGSPSSWEGMYDDQPPPQNMGGGPQRRGSFGGGRGRGNMGSQPPVANAPANAPTGPKNAGRPGANYRGGGRGGHRAFHPYARGGG